MGEGDRPLTHSFHLIVVHSLSHEGRGHSNECRARGYVRSNCDEAAPVVITGPRQRRVSR